MKNMAVMNSDGVVENIIVCDDLQQDTDTLIEYTSANPATIGGDRVDGYFYPPQPFPSWTRHEGEWLPPVPMPNDGQLWRWDEDDQRWNPVTE